MTETSPTYRYNWETGFLLPAPLYPKTATEYQGLLDAGNFDALEAMLMERLDAAPQDIAFYLPAYKAFVKRQESSRAEALLQLHLDCLQTRDDMPAQSALLCNMLAIWPECPTARNAALRHLREMYGGSPGFDRFLAHCKIPEGACGLEPLRQLELWLRYDEGRVVYVASRGIARVKEANPKLGLIRIAFESGEAMTLRIDEAQRLAQSLSKEHFLFQKIERPDRLAAWAESDSSGLLESLFSSMKRPLPLVELRGLLSGVVAETQWSGWWSKASKDPHVTVGAGSKPIITWNDSASGAESAILDQFDSAPVAAQLDMLQQHGKRSEKLALHMKRRLAQSVQTLRSTEPSRALEIALLLENDAAARDLPADFAPSDLVRGENAAAVIAGIRDRMTRRKAVILAEQVRSDWRELYVRILETESDAQIIGILYSALREKNDEDAFENLIRNTLDDPARFPRFYVWLCKEMSRRTELAPFAQWNFLLPLLSVLDHDAFKGHHPALRKLFDLGEAADRAIASLDEAGARRLLDALSRDRSLEEYRTDRIKKELFQRFPQLHEQKTQTLYVTQEALEIKRVEFEKLVKEEIPHNTKEIQRTREFGDLRENFEYHAARHRQEMLSSRAKTLHDQLSWARIIDPATVDISKISIGTRVTLRPVSETGTVHTLTVLGPWDSDPARNVLSYTSAAGEQLLNAALGSAVKFDGNDYIVDKIELWDDKTERIT